MFTRGTTEAINLVAEQLRPAPAGRRRNPRHRNGAPLQHRPLAAPLPAQRRGAARGADRRRRRADRRSSSQRLLGPRTRLVALTHMSNALGTHQPGQDAGRPGPSGRRRGADRRRAGGRPPAGGCARTSTAISTPSPATSSTAPPASACSTAGRRCSKPCRPTRAAAT